ncbi:hypothetical protein, partial [Cronobacter sakazakii]
MAVKSVKKAWGALAISLLMAG